MAEMYEDILL